MIEALDIAEHVIADDWEARYDDDAFWAQEARRVLALSGRDGVAVVGHEEALHLFGDAFVASGAYLSPELFSELGDQVMRVVFLTPGAKRMLPPGLAALSNALDRCRVDLVAHGEQLPEEREWLPASRRFLARGKRYHVAAKGKSGKSIAFLAHAVDMVLAGARVVILDRENGADEYAARLRDILRDHTREQRATVAAGLRYFHWLPLALEHGQALPVVFAGYDLVIFDSTRTFTSRLNLNEDKSDDYAVFASSLIEPLFQAGIATVLLDNTGHEATNRARGTAAKSDLADVPMVLEKVKEFDKDNTGMVRLRIVGGARLGDVARNITMELGGGKFDPFVIADDDAAREPDTVVAAMARVAAVIAATSGLITTEVYDKTPGNKDDNVTALKRLVAEGYVHRQSDGRKKRCFLARPFPDADTHDDSSVPPAFPDHPQGTVSDPSSVPPSFEDGERRTGAGLGAQCLREVTA